MNPVIRFSMLARALHWVMALLILAMLFIGVFMAATVGPHYAALVALHRPIGIAILLLAVLRLVNRFIVPPPPLPADIPPLVRFAATASHVLLYALMIGMPLVGWAMLSAGGYPIVMAGGLHLPPILPTMPSLYAVLRHLHTLLAFSLFGIILLHLGAALMHGLILRDGVFGAMASWRAGRRNAA